VEFNSFFGMNCIQSHGNNVIKQVAHFLTRGYVSKYISIEIQKESTKKKPAYLMVSAF
jgi:hypothetical protein